MIFKKDFFKKDFFKKDSLKEHLAKELVDKYNMDYNEALSVFYSNPFLDDVVNVVIKSKRIDKLIKIDNMFVQIGVIILGFQLLKLLEKILE